MGLPCLCGAHDRPHRGIRPVPHPGRPFGGVPGRLHPRRGPAGRGAAVCRLRTGALRGGLRALRPAHHLDLDGGPSGGLPQVGAVPRLPRRDPPVHRRHRGDAALQADDGTRRRLGRAHAVRVGGWRGGLRPADVGVLRHGPQGRPAGPGVRRPGPRARRACGPLAGRGLRRSARVLRLPGRPRPHGRQAPGTGHHRAAAPPLGEPDPGRRRRGRSADRRRVPFRLRRLRRVGHPARGVLLGAGRQAAGGAAGAEVGVGVAPPYQG